MPNKIRKETGAAIPSSEAKRIAKKKLKSETGAASPSSEIDRVARRLSGNSWLKKNR